MRLSNTVGVLLINLGTPQAPTKRAVSQYLREFLTDPRVIELPYILRKLLVDGIIIPTRAKKSAHAYCAIWQDAGSPLLVHSKHLQSSLQQSLGAQYTVVLGMRYGSPSITTALQELYAQKVRKIIVIPLFPQYASATNGSAIAAVMQYIAKQKEIIPFTVLTDFHDVKAYVAAQAEIIRPFINESNFLLMSYHGLPRRQLINEGLTCYKTKCIASSRLIANQLQLQEQQWCWSFQSRLGKLEWIKPYTEEVLYELRAKGIKRLVVACPSFVADCLETLEEIGIRARAQWLSLGGTHLDLVPCLNADPNWVLALGDMVRNTESSS